MHKGVGNGLLNLFSCQLIEQLVKRALPIICLLALLGVAVSGGFSAVFPGGGGGT